MSDLLRADGIAAFRGERLVLEGVCLALPPGGALFLLGPNGSGKSTLLRVLAGLKRADAGTVTGPENPAYLGHADAIKPGLTVSENLRFAAAGRPIGPALAALGLADLADLPARMLSAGQRRRLALARLPLSPSPVWLLDEPTLGLDTASLGLLAQMLATHRAGGGGVVAATHQDLDLPDAGIVRLGAPTGSAANRIPLPLREGLGEGWPPHDNRGVDAGKQEKSGVRPPLPPTPSHKERGKKQ